MTPVPHPQPTLRRVRVGHLSLAAFEWHADLRGHAPTLFLVHATSFHGRVWDQMLAHLPPMHVLSFEQRGHGRSDAAPFTDWEAFCTDLEGALAALDVQGAVGVGHSMGGHAMVRVAARQPERFRQLVLVDPGLFDPARYLHETPLPQEPHPATFRKNRFDSVQAMIDRLGARLPYATFTPQALRDYCEHGLRPAADGQGYELACQPHTEGMVYQTARRDPWVHDSMRQVRVPVTVIRARPADPTIRPFDTLGSGTWPDAARAFPNGRDVFLPDKTHLMPMEDPALVARLIEEAMATA